MGVKNVDFWILSSPKSKNHPLSPARLSAQQSGEKRGPVSLIQTPGQTNDLIASQPGNVWAVLYYDRP
jgi:hypothetical protein